MRAILRSAASGAVLTLVALPLHAQGNIVDDDVTFRRTLTPFDDTPTADLVGVSPVGTQDHLFETGWWYRVAGDSREFALPPPTQQSYVGDSSFLAWADVAGRDLFAAQEMAVVYDGGFPGVPDKGNVFIQFIVHNLSSVAPLAIDLFHFVDFDLQPTAGDDRATLGEWTYSGLIDLRDAGGNFANYQAFQPTSYLVLPFGSADVAARLADDDLDDFDDSGLPFGPGDFTAGYQFTRVVPPSGSTEIQIQLSVNWSTRCLSSDVGLLCDGFEIGDTSVWSQTVP
jgi:hypothetical protein